MRFLKSVIVFFACLANVWAGEISYIANHGVSISHNQTTVVIDGLFTKTYPQFDAPTEEEINALTSNGGGPNQLVYSLVSHKHSDHFNAELTQKLIKNTKAKVWLPDDISLPLENIENRLRLIQPSCTNILRPLFDSAELSIACLSLTHVGQDSVENIAYVISLNGLVFLHVGDADASAQNMQIITTQLKQLDYVFLPPWFLKDRQLTQTLINTYQNLTVVLTHLPEQSASSIAAQVKEQHNIKPFYDEIGSLKF